jgi:protein gp37
MSDVFHAHFTLGMIKQVFEVMNRATQHQFQLLTKRPERAARLAEHFEWTPNIWIGTSIEDRLVIARADALRRVPAAIRFVSAEPLLGSLDDLNLTDLHWVIGGGESGPGFRPPKEEWALSLRDRCVAAGVAFFWKQWGGLRPKSGGRLLGGCEWNEYPDVRAHQLA